MRLPFMKPRQRVEIMTPGATLEWMRSRSQQLIVETGEDAARGLMDAFLGDQKRPRHERREWLAHLFDGLPAHPTPFGMTGEDVVGRTWTDHRLAALVKQQDWAGVEQHLLNQGWPAAAVADTVRHLIEGPPRPVGGDAESLPR